MFVSIGPELTPRQQEQRDATERAAEALRQQGIRCKVVYLWAGEKFPNADSASIIVEPHP